MCIERHILLYLDIVDAGSKAYKASPSPNGPVRHILIRSSLIGYINE